MFACFLRKIAILLMTLKQSVLATMIISADPFRTEIRCISFELKTDELEACKGLLTDRITAT